MIENKKLKINNIKTNKVELFVFGLAAHRASEEEAREAYKMGQAVVGHINYWHDGFIRNRKIIESKESKEYKDSKNSKKLTWTQAKKYFKEYMCKKWKISKVIKLEFFLFDNPFYR